MKQNLPKNPSKPASEGRAMPQGPPARAQLQQPQSAPHTARIPAQLLAGGARLSIPATNPLGQHILGATPLQVQVSRIGTVSAGQPITTHVVAGPKTQAIQIPKLTVGKTEQGMHTVSLGQGDTPVTSGTHITHLLSGSSIASLGAQHVNLGHGQGPQRVTIQTMGQAQNPVSTQPVALTLTQASNSQATIGHGQHVGIVSNQMASIICSNKPRLTSQPTQLLQAFPSIPQRAGTPKSVMSHFSARGPIITPIRTATISNRPNSPAVPHSTGLSITVPSSQLGEQPKFRTLTAGPGMEINQINLQAGRTLHETRPVISHSGATKTIQLSHHPHAGGQKIVMATTAMPPGSHASITVAITKPIGSQIVASALLPSNVTTVTSASLTSSQAIPIAKVTPQRFTQITQQSQGQTLQQQPVMQQQQPQQQQQVQQHHQQQQVQQQHVQEQPVSSHSATTLYLPPRPLTTTTTSSVSATAVDVGKTEPRSVSQMIQYFGSGHQYDPQHYSNLSHFQLSTTSSQVGASLRPTLVTAQPAITVAPASASLSLPASLTNPPRLNQVVVMDPNRQIQVRASTANTASLQTVHIPVPQSQIQAPQSPAHIPQSPGSGTPSASPRPSILRKRTNEGFPVVSKKALFTTTMEQSGSRPEQVSSPKNSVTLESQRETSQSSTDTASSQDGSTNSTPTATEMKVKLENPDDENSMANILLRDGTSSMEASPRKKPRKQLLQANEELKDEVMSASSSDDEGMAMDETDIKEEIKIEYKDEHIDEEGVRWITYKKRPDFSLLNHYSCTWKTKNNHFLRYTDVRPKDERRPTVNELSNQKHIQQKSSGWKLFHLAAQLDDLVVAEGEVKDSMANIQAELAPEGQKQQYGSVVDDVVMIHELTQANIQRSKLIVDQMKEVRQSMLNLLDHKKKIDEIVTKHRSRRPVKSKARM